LKYPQYVADGNDRALTDSPRLFIFAKKSEIERIRVYFPKRHSGLGHTRKNWFSKFERFCTAVNRGFATRVRSAALSILRGKSSITSKQLSPVDAQASI
jgi:hypothetical protein